MLWRMGVNRRPVVAGKPAWACVLVTLNCKELQRRACASWSRGVAVSQRKMTGAPGANPVAADLPRGLFKKKALFFEQRA